MATEGNKGSMMHRAKKTEFIGLGFRAVGPRIAEAALVIYGVASRT